MPNTKYNQLIERIEINKIELLGLNCYQNPEFSSLKRTNLDIGIQHETEKVVVEGAELQVHFKFDLTAFHNDNEKEDVEIKEQEISQEDILFNVNFILNLTYSIDLDDIKEMMELGNEINTFIERNVPINAWPYARETVSSLTTRMGFPALVIPSYKNIPKS